MASPVLEEYLRKTAIRQPTTRRLLMIRSSQINELEVSVAWKRKSKRQDDGAEMASAVLEGYLRKASIRQPTTRRLSMIRSSQKNEVEVSVSVKRKSKRQDDGTETASAVLEEYLRKAAIIEPTTRRLLMIRSSQKNEVEVSVSVKRKSKRQDDGTETASAVLEEYLRKAAIREPTTRRLLMIRSSQKNEVEVSEAWKRNAKRQDDGTEMASPVLEEYLRKTAIRQPTTRRLLMIRSSQKNEVEVSVAWKRNAKRQDDGTEMASPVLEEYLRKTAIRQPTTRRLLMIRSSQKNELEVSVAWKRKLKRQDDGTEMASAVLEEYLRKASIRQPTTRRLSMIRSSQKNEVEVSVAWKRNAKRQDDGTEMASPVLEEYLRKTAIRQPTTRRLLMIRGSQKNELEVSVAWKRKLKRQDDGTEMASAVLEEYLRKASIRQPTTRRLSMIRSSQKNEVEVSVSLKRKSKRQDDGAEMASAVLEEYLRKASIRQPTTRRLSMIRSSQKNEVEVSVAWKRNAKRQDDGTEMASPVLEEYLRKTAIRQPTTRRLLMIRSSQKNELEVSVAWKRKLKRQDDGAEMASAVLEEYLRKAAIRQPTTRRLSMIRSSQKNEVEVSVSLKRNSKRHDDGAEMASAVLEEYLRKAAIRQPTTRRLSMIRSSQKNEVEVSVSLKRKSKRQDDGAEMASAVLEEYLRKASIRQPTTRRLSMIRSSQKNEVEVSVSLKRKSKRQDDGAEMASAVLEEYLRKAAIRQPTTRRLLMIRSSQKNEVEPNGFCKQPMQAIHHWSFTRQLAFGEQPEDALQSPTTWSRELREAFAQKVLDFNIFTKLCILIIILVGIGVTLLMWLNDSAAEKMLRSKYNVIEQASGNNSILTIGMGSEQEYNLTEIQ